ncbi:hypothetical protein HanHA300_Chr16g0618711 [Helianthus annuus]|nr:hypothetical protein HanHA300_Chr16g0618711 [Helianthus annuus]KAJ0461196.1 hypothetical protein HanHA89_Chr16g0669611 [Helianthus annuus]KAJ0645503.1 hypothetical protein HanOQP8_Chr16g0624681 [Helianthus annuus]
MPHLLRFDRSQCSKGKKLQSFCIWALYATRMEVPCLFNAGRLIFKYQARNLGGSRPASTYPITQRGSREVRFPEILNLL